LIEDFAVLLKHRAGQLLAKETMTDKKKGIWIIERRDGVEYLACEVEFAQGIVYVRKPVRANGTHWEKLCTSALYFPIDMLASWGWTDDKNYIKQYNIAGAFAEE